MCGRFSQKIIQKEIQELFQLEPNINLRERTIAPTDIAIVIRKPFLGEYPKNSTPQFVASPHSFGLLPSWADLNFKTNFTFNAKSETLEEKPAFRGAYKYKRCVIPISGFYEWKTVGKKKIPHFFELKNNKPFLLAGLYDILERHDAFIQSFCIITQNAKGQMLDYHDRMPVILSLDNARDWVMGAGKIENYMNLEVQFQITEKNPNHKEAEQGLF